MPINKVEINEEDLRHLFKQPTVWQRLGKRFWRFVLSLIVVAALVGSLLLSLNAQAYYQRFRYQIKSRSTVTSTTPPAAATDQLQSKTNYLPEIKIAKIGVNAPLVFPENQSEVIPSLGSGVALLPGSAEPGQKGNTVLIGHSSDFPWSTGRYKTVFALLDALKSGDEILIPYQRQILRYQVTESKVVQPTDLSVVEPTPEPTLTLITCYPVGTTKNRLIVRARLISGLVGEAQPTKPVITNLPRVR